jgi:hypothetical protein
MGALCRAFTEGPILLEDEADAHGDEKARYRAGKIGNTEYVERMKYGEIQTDTDYSCDKKLGDPQHRYDGSILAVADSAGWGCPNHHATNVKAAEYLLVLGGYRWTI